MWEQAPRLFIAKKVLMRKDNRKPDAMRPVFIERYYTKNAPGSVLISFGDTRVICTAVIEKKVPPFLKDSGKGWVTAEYGMLPTSTHNRITRDSINKGRAQEISRLIGRTLRAVTDMQALGECQITIDCDVIQADGGTRTASVTGAYVAVHDALTAAVRAGNIPRIPLKGHCAAVSVGIVDNEILLDLAYEEDNRAQVDMNIVMNDNGEFLEVQGSAEKKPFSRKLMDQMLAYGESGIQQLIDLQKKVLS